MSSKEKDIMFKRPAREEEADLVERARSGDVEAFGGLVSLNQDRVYNLSYRLTGQPDRAWDLSQEAFMKAYSAIQGFRGGSAFYTWIYRIVLNLHMNRENSMGGRMERRTLSIDRTVDDDHRSALKEDLSDGTDGDPSQDLVRRERGHAVQEAISMLPPDQRQVVLLRDMEGMSYEEIADLLSVPLGTVRSRLHRAREELKRRLERIL